MKITNLIVPIIALTVINNPTQVRADLCEERCSEALHYGIDQCTANSLPWMVLGCYAGCGVFYGGCMALCAAAR